MDRQTITTNLSQLPTEPNARALLCSRASARHEERGEYDEAVETLSSLWAGMGTRPETANLSPAAAAVVLLRAGSLTGWLGSKRQIEGWQEQAKNLLSESADISESAADMATWLEARKHLAICYWREGAFDDAHVIASAALERSERGSEQWITLNLTLALIERSEKHYQQALDIHAAIARDVEGATDPVKGMFHNGLGLTHRNLGNTDEAIIQLTAAAYYFGRCEHSCHLIATEINLANLLVDAGQFSEAHHHLDRADQLASAMSDEVHLAQSKDSRALLFIAEKKYEEAEEAAAQSVLILTTGDEHGLLVDALVTRARALARLRDSDSLEYYLRAYNLASSKIGSERAARVLGDLIGEMAGDVCITGHATLDGVIEAFEESIIRKALDHTGNKISAAAMLLGLSHQNLSLILHTRHKKLQPHPERKKRRRSIIKL